MRWKLLNVATALSLLLLCAVIVLWVRSYYRWDVLGHKSAIAGQTSWTDHQLESLPGMIRYLHRSTRSTALLTTPWSPGWWMSSLHARSRDQVVSLLLEDGYYIMGFGHTSGHTKQATSSGTLVIDYWGIFVPYWALFVLFLVTALPWLLTNPRARHREQLGLCPKCGYDLRATPGRCPECGAGQ